VNPGIVLISLINIIFSFSLTKKSSLEIPAAPIALKALIDNSLIFSLFASEISAGIINSVLWSLYLA